MRLKRATSMKAYRRRRRNRRPAELGDELGAPVRRRRRRRPQRRPQPRPRPAAREQRRQRRAERVRQRLWSDPVALGENIRIQAADGYRGAFLELRPGLYLVAELRDEAFRRDEFGRRVKVQDVTNEIVRVTDKALDTIFPARRANKRAEQDALTRRAQLVRRERELARKEREAAERRGREQAQREAQERQAQQQAARALPAPRAPLALPAPREPALPTGAARWLDEDEDELAGCCCERRRR
jgi:dTMP kinase